MNDLERELKELRETLEVVNRTAADIVVSQTGVEAIRRLAEAARERLGARYAAVGVAREEGDGLEAFLTVGLTPEQEKAIGPRPRGAGVLGLLLTRKEPLRLDRLSAHPNSAGFPPGHPPMESFLGVPIIQGARVLGSLYLTEKPGGFTEADELTVLTLSGFLGVAIQNHQILNRQRALVGQLIQAQEEERRAVAYDLHDGLTQYVMAAHAQLETYQALMADGKTERAAPRLQAGIGYLKEAVIESRRLVNGLRTLALDDLGLVGAIEPLLRDEKERAGWAETSLEENLGGERFALPVETAAFRIVQEALTNIRKHAQATRVVVRLSVTLEGLTLQVTDNGAGFSLNEARSQAEHIGLHGMAERARLLGGTLDITSKSRAGTTLQAWLPLRGNRENDG